MVETLNLKKTAFVMIDLQKGIALRPHLVPYSGQQVLDKNERIAKKLANTQATIVCVHVKNDGPEILRPITDQTPISVQKQPADFSDFVLPIATDPSVKNLIHVKKHNWGAFYGTDLEVQLRRRGIDTIILSGIATSIGVDTTAREAYQAGYQLISLEDAMTDLNAALHNDTVEHIFTRIGRVRTTLEIIEMIAQS